MELLTQYIDEGNRGCTDFNNLRSAILASVYAVKSPTLSRIALFIRQNRTLMNVQDNKISERTLRYMVLCLQRYGLIAELDNGTYEICAPHEAKIAEILGCVNFKPLDDTPIDEAVDEALKNVRAQESIASTIMLQSMYFGLPPTVVENSSHQTNITVETQVQPQDETCETSAGSTDGIAQSAPPSCDTPAVQPAPARWGSRCVIS